MPYFSIRRSKTLGVLALAGTCAIARADNEDSGKLANLAVTPFVSGSTCSIKLRSTLEGRPAFVLASPGNGPLVGRGFTLHLDPVFVVLRGGVVSNAGALDLNVKVPATGFGGLSFFMQGVVLGPVGRPIASNPLAVVVDASQSAAFADGTDRLPPSAGTLVDDDTDSSDIDGDGDFDLVVATDTGVHIYVNDGTGHFADQTSQRLPGVTYPTSCVELGDVDNDGYPDLFIGGGLSAPQDPTLPNALYRNNGAGAFAQIPSFPTGKGVTADAEFGDIDNDGDLDLLLANGQDGAHGGEIPDADDLLINQGGIQGGVEGEFLSDPGFASAPFNDPLVVTNDAALGDIDNDGDLDIFLATSDIPNFGAVDLLLRNEGGLVFTDITSTNISPLYADNDYEASFVDVNGDGLLDLVLAQSLLSSWGPTLYINQGFGTFFEDFNFPQLPDVWQQIRLGLDVADVDLDGDPDLLLCIHHLFDSTGNPAGESLLFLNQGGAQHGLLGEFALDTSFTQYGVYVVPDAAFLDIDNDGDLDVHIANSGDLIGNPPADHLLRNTLR